MKALMNAGNRSDIMHKLEELVTNRPNCKSVSTCDDAIITDGNALIQTMPEPKIIKFR